MGTLSIQVGGLDKDTQPKSNQRQGSLAALKRKENPRRANAPCWPAGNSPRTARLIPAPAHTEKQREPCASGDQRDSARALMLAFFSFFRRFFSPGSHKWQKGQSLALLQPGSFHANAQGLQRPWLWATEPADGMAVPSSCFGSSEFSSGRSSTAAPQDPWTTTCPNLACGDSGIRAGANLAGGWCAIAGNCLQSEAPLTGAGNWSQSGATVAASGQVGHSSKIEPS